MDLAKNNMLHYRGIATSPGIAMGRLRVFDRRHLTIDEYSISQAETSREIERLQAGIQQTRNELKSLKDKLKESTGDDHLFFIETHLLILSDDHLFTETVEHINGSLINAECALRRSMLRYREIFGEIDDHYLRERISDVETVIEKVLRNMAGTPHAPILPDGYHIIIAAHDITPADLLQIDRTRVIGIVTEIGGKTSHTSILARAFELPAVAGVVGVDDLSLDGSPVILDGLTGEIIVRPDTATMAEYTRRKQQFESAESELLKLAELAPETIDRHRVVLRGNVEVPEEGPSVLRHGGEGIGLYRTEMLFMNRREMPDEEEQYRVYAAMQHAIAPHALTFRTLDAGGDKLLDGVMHGNEQNPVLGVRAIRLALRMPDEFKKQLRAILRVSAFGDVRIMFPMISGLEELRNAKALLAEAKNELEAAGIPFDHSIKTGIMIEIPSAVVMSDVLAGECDFFSVGTNDLIQYTLAIDRSNEHLAHMYQPLHPAVLRSLRQVVTASGNAGIDACICGEMAGEPLFLPVLLGLGYRELSMGAGSIPRVKRLLRGCSLSWAKQVADTCTAFTTAEEANTYLREIMSPYLDGN